MLFIEKCPTVLGKRYLLRSYNNKGLYFVKMDTELFWRVIQAMFWSDQNRVPGSISVNVFEGYN